MSKKKAPPKIEIVPDTKILLEIERPADHEGRSILSLGSYIEEVISDNLLLIKTPIHRGYNYLLPRNKPLHAYFFMHSRMFSLTLQCLESVQRDNLEYAKVRVLSALQPGQRRDCFRLQECTLPVMLERHPAPKTDPTPPMPCRLINLSDGGMLIATNHEFTKGETVNITFDIGTVETVKAEVLRLESPYDIYKHTIAVKFLHKCKHQKHRFYVFIVEQQRERLRQQAENDMPLRVV